MTRGRCPFPMWGNRERPTFRFCGDPVASPGARGLAGRWCARCLALVRRPEPGEARPPAAAPIRKNRAPRSSTTTATTATTATAATKAKPGRRSTLDLPRALAMREAGETVPAIAAALGCAGSTVMRALAAQGVALGRWTQRASAAHTAAGAD